MVPPDWWDSRDLLEVLVHLGRPELLDSAAQQDLMVPRETLVQQVYLEQPGLLDHQEARVLPELPVQRVQVEVLVDRVLRVWLVRPAVWDCRAIEGWSV